MSYAVKRLTENKVLQAELQVTDDRDGDSVATQLCVILYDKKLNMNINSVIARRRITFTADTSQLSCYVFCCMVNMFQWKLLCFCVMLRFCRLCAVWLRKLNSWSSVIWLVWSHHSPERKIIPHRQQGLLRGKSFPLWHFYQLDLNPVKLVYGSTSAGWWLS